MNNILGALVLLKVVDTLLIESRPRSLFKIDLLAITLIQPVEKVLQGILCQPVPVVDL